MTQATVLPPDRVLSNAWRQARPGLFAILFFSLAINVLKFATPLYLLQVLDRIPASRSVETLVMLTIVTGLAIATGIALEIIRRRMLANWRSWVDLNIGARVAQRSLEGSFDKRADLRASLDDVDRMSKLALRCQSFFDVLWAPFFFLVLFLMHPMLGWMATISILLLILLAAARELTTKEPRRAARSAMDEANAVLAGASTNHDTVVAHSMAAAVVDRWRRMRQKAEDMRAERSTRAIVLGGLITALGRLTRIGIIGLGAWLLLRDELTIGGMFASRVLAGFGFSLVEHVVRDWHTLRDGLSGYRNTRARLAATDHATASIEADAAKAPVILDAVTFKYRGQRRELFRRLSLVLAPCEVLAVTGPAATGKSTFSRLLVGLLVPRYGQVRLGDVDISRLPEEVRAGLIGYMTQSTELFHGTVRENIERLGDGPLSKAVEAARLIDMHERIVRLPAGYDTVIGPDYEGLSGSERKRIALARAFYGKPRLIVLDEPSANLDRVSRRAMEGAIQALKAEGSSIVITQAIPSPKINGIADKFIALTDSGLNDEVAGTPADAAEEAERHLRSVR